MKGVFDKETSLNKAREHSLLRSDRPAYVTILSLGAPPPPPPSKGWRARVAPGSFAVGTWRVGSCPESQGILGSFQEALQWGHGGHAPAQGHRESLVPSRKLCSGDMEGMLLPRVTGNPWFLPGSFAVGTWRAGSCPESHMESLFSSWVLCLSLSSFRNCSVSLGARICFLQTRVFLKVRFFTFFVP